MACQSKSLKKTSVRNCKYQVPTIFIPEYVNIIIFLRMNFVFKILELAASYRVCTGTVPTRYLVQTLLKQWNHMMILNIGKYNNQRLSEHHVISRKNFRKLLYPTYRPSDYAARDGSCYSSYRYYSRQVQYDEQRIRKRYQVPGSK
jgi:hypothetical protein